MPVQKSQETYWRHHVYGFKYFMHSYGFQYFMLLYGFKYFMQLYGLKYFMQLYGFYVNTTLWMHHIDADERPREKDRWELPKNKSWKQQHETTAVWSFSSYTKTIWVRWTRQAGHCWRSKDNLIRDVLPLTSIHEPASVGQPAL